MHVLQQIKKQSVTQQASEVLNDYILNGNLKAGDFLPSEKELCKQIGIGRSTLREAIKILESQGLVRKKHGFGVVIVDESDRVVKDLLKMMIVKRGSAMKELIDVRTANELKTTELAAINATDEDIQKIEHHLNIMRDNMTSTEAYVKADIDFHMAIAESSKNKVFFLILQTIRPLLEEMIEETLKYNHRPEQSMGYHEKIYSAIKEHRPSAAVKAMREHLNATEKMLNA